MDSVRASKVSRLMRKLKSSVEAVEFLANHPVMTYKPENAQRSYFRLFYLSRKLEQIIDFAVKHLNKVSNTRAIFRRKKWKILIHAPGSSVVETCILKQSEEIKAHLKEVQLSARSKMLFYLSEALSLPREVLITIVDKFVEIQDEEGPNNEEIWKVEDAAVAEVAVDEDDHQLEENYNALAVIFEAVRKDFASDLEKDFLMLSVLKLHFLGTKVRYFDHN